MDKFSNFVIANSFLALLPLFLQKGLACSTLSVVKAIKARIAGELALFTPVTKGAVAAGA